LPFLNQGITRARNQFLRERNLTISRSVYFVDYRSSIPSINRVREYEVLLINPFFRSNCGTLLLAWNTKQPNNHSSISHKDSLSSTCPSTVFTPLNETGSREAVFFRTMTYVTIFVKGSPVSNILFLFWACDFQGTKYILYIILYYIKRTALFRCFLISGTGVRIPWHGPPPVPAPQVQAGQADPVSHRDRCGVSSLANPAGAGESCIRGLGPSGQVLGWLHW
jgi:hypothetical protein